MDGLLFLRLDGQCHFVPVEKRRQVGSPSLATTWSLCSSLRCFHPGFTGPKVSVTLQPQVGGTAVRAGGKREKLQVVHGPRKSACAAAPGCEACDLRVKSSWNSWNPHGKIPKKTWSLLLEKKHSHFSWSHLWHINKFYNYNYILYIYWGCGLATLTFYGSRKSQGIILGFAMSLWNSWEVLISIFANDLICLGIPEFDQKIDLYTQWPATHGDGARCLVPPWSSVVHKQAWDETIKRRHWGCTVDIPSWLWGWASAFAKMWMNGMQGKSALRTLLNMSIMIIMS